MRENELSVLTKIVTKNSEITEKLNIPLYTLQRMAKRLELKKDSISEL